jgi:hypothetical protein
MKLEIFDIKPKLLIYSIKNLFIVGLGVEKS